MKNLKLISRAINIFVQVSWKGILTSGVLAALVAADIHPVVTFFALLLLFMIFGMITAIDARGVRKATEQWYEAKAREAKILKGLTASFKTYDAKADMLNVRLKHIDDKMKVIKELVDNADEFIKKFCREQIKINEEMEERWTSKNTSTPGTTRKGKSGNRKKRILSTSEIRKEIRKNRS